MADDSKNDFSKFVPDGQLLNLHAPTYGVHYVNSSRMGISPWDVRITVGQVIEQNGQQVNQDAGTFVMSPQHAKQFLQSLGSTVRSYEEMFGPIPEPAAVIEKANKARAEAAAQPPKPLLTRRKSS